MKAAHLSSVVHPRNSLIVASSHCGNLVSRKANLSFARVISARVYAFSTRLIQLSMFFLSRLGSSGFRNALTWLVWFASAAVTAASVAILDCRSLSSRSCLRANSTAWAVILFTVSSSIMTAAGGSKSKWVVAADAEALGEGDLDLAMFRKRC